MIHRCTISDLLIIEDHRGYLYLQYNKLGVTEFQCRIAYCPICGLKSKKHPTEVDNIDLNDIKIKTIDDLNKNIECIKSFMITQNILNEIMRDNTNSLRKKIIEIDEKVK